MPRSRALLLVFALSIVAGGCASAGDRTASAPTWTLHYEAGTPVRLAAQAWPVEIDDSTALFPFSEQPVGPVGRLASLDLATGRRSVLARTGFPGGTIMAAVRVGDEIVYVDESARGDLTPGAARWKVIALHAHRVLASSGGRRVTTSPDLEVVDGTAVWTVYPDQGGALHAFGWKPGGTVRPQDALPGDARECSPPAADPEHVGSCDRRNGWVVWVEDDALHAARDGGEPVRLGKVAYDVGGPEIFGDYVLWDRGYELVVTSLLHPSASAVVMPREQREGGTFYGTGDDDTAGLLLQDDGTSSLLRIEADQLRLTSTG